MKKRRLLFIDHHDSFSANLIAFFKQEHFEVMVTQSHAIGRALFNPNFLTDFCGVVFSPGPKSPADYPLSLQLYKNLPTHIPVLGVCLGHQLMLYADGATVQTISQAPVHGRRLWLDIDACRSAPDGPFRGMGIFYNSLAVAKTDPLFQKHGWRCVKAVDNWAVVAEHALWPRFGLQFHPESFASTVGAALLQSFTKHFLKNTF